MAETSEKKWYESSNFWTDVVMIVGVVLVGFPSEAGISSIAAIFALIAGAKAIREGIKAGTKADWKGAINNSNFWNYLAAVVVAIVPGIPVELFGSVETAAQNLISGNLQGALIAGFSIFTILYNWLKKKPAAVKV